MTLFRLQLVRVAILSASVAAFQPHHRGMPQVVSKATFPTSQMPTKNSILTSSERRTFHAKDSTELASTTNAKTDGEVDSDALVKYAVAGVVQMSLVFGLFSALDAGITALDLSVPFVVNCALFYGFSLKSRVFNPLSNERPKPKNIDDQDDGPIRPSWTPPGVFFPIMWLLIIGPIRAYSASLVYETTGSYACAAILAFMLHLTVGDIWNTVNNVEKRVGASAGGVLFVLLSAINAAYQYYQAEPFAGNMLGLTIVWLSIAASLVNAIRLLNPDKATGEIEALYPVKGEVETEFAWLKKEA
jgi:benzodiazapine receptor